MRYYGFDVTNLYFANVCQSCSMRLFCSHLENDQLFLQQRTLKKNEVLHHARDKFTHLYAIRQGALKSQTSDYQGIERIHYLYLKDEIYGFDGIYNAYYPYETTAMCPTIICEISYPYFLELMHHNTQLLEASLQLMSQQLTANHYLQLHSAQQKVAAFLLDLAKRLHKLENELIVLPLVYQDIGNYLNLAPETISRVLAKFKQSNMISLSKKMMRILNLDKLKELAH